MSDPSLPTPFNQHRPTPPPEEIGTFQSISGSPSIPTLGRRKDDDSESIFHKCDIVVNNGLSVPQPHSNGVSRAWSRIGKLVQEFNDDISQRTIEELDTLLVFVGLFSAVVSAFLTLSYQSLQENSDDVTARTLLIISQQLGSLSVQPGFQNLTVLPASVSDSFKPHTLSIIINVLWTSCLATSLMISFGIILLKYILRLSVIDHRLVGISQPRPKEYRARYFRLLDQSTGFRLANYLPMLLLFSLTLFLIGLLLYVIQLNHLVAGLTVLMVELPLWVWLLSGVAPYFNLVIQHIKHGMEAEDPRFLDPRAAVRQQRRWDLSVLVTTEKFVGQDDGVHLELTRECLAEAPAEDVYSYIRQILPERASQPFLGISSLKQIPSLIFRELSDDSLTASAKIVGDAIERLLDGRNGGASWSEDYDEGVSFLAQIDPLRAIPEIPALFGRLISNGGEFAFKVVAILGETEWRAYPTIINSQAFINLIGGIERVLKPGRVASPPDLTFWLFSTVSRMENSILDTHREEFQRLLGHIAADMELQPQLVPSASTANEGYERLLPLVATLNAKQSGLVNGKIVEVIAQQATRPRVFENPVDGKSSRWARLTRMSEAVARSRRRQGGRAA